MILLTTVLQAIFLFIAIVISIYVWFYRAGVKNTRQRLGIDPPGYLDDLLVINWLFSLIIVAALGLTLFAIFQHPNLLDR